MTDLKADFLKQTGWDETVKKELAGDASSRRYTRLFRVDKAAILMEDPDGTALQSYLNITEYLNEQGYSVPTVLEKDQDGGFLILEDFGDDLFARLLETGGDEAALYNLALDFLISLRGAELPKGVKFFNSNYVLDQNAMFLDWYVPFRTGKVLEDKARIFFQQIWRDLLSHLEDQPEVFLHRDFHAENLFHLSGRDGVKALGLIDFQDAMTGPPAYDLVSLLQDARRDVSPEVASTVLRTYMQKMAEPEQEFRRLYAILGAHRAMRILGIFTRLKEQDGKMRYDAFRPRVIAHLNANLAHPDLIALKHWVKVTLGELI